METKISSSSETRDRRRRRFFDTHGPQEKPPYAEISRYSAPIRLFMMGADSRPEVWGFDHKKVTWEDVNAAGDTFKAELTDAGKFVITSKSRGEIPAISYNVRRIRDDMMKIIQHKLYCEWVKIPIKRLKIPIKDITEEDVANFDFNLKMAEQELELFDKYISYDANVIQHDSSVEGIVEKILEDKHDMCRLSAVAAIIKRYTERTKLFWHDVDPIGKFCVFLSKFYLLQSNDAGLDDCFKKLKADPDYAKMKFDDVPPRSLIDELQPYIFHLKTMCSFSNKTIEEARSDYEKVAHAQQQALILSYQKMRKRVLTEFMTPFHFLAYQRMTEGYEIRGPVIEIIKVRFYAGEFLAGVHRWTPNDRWQCYQPKFVSIVPLPRHHKRKAEL